MGFIKKLYLNYLINKDENFLLKKGFKKAKENGLEVCLCQTYPCSNNEKIHLPSYEGKIDVTNLISIVADDFPEVTKRYLNNKKLNRLIRGSLSKT